MVRSRRSRRLEPWPRVRSLPPSFEARASPSHLRMRTEKGFTPSQDEAFETLASDSNEGIDWTDGRRARRGDPRHAMNIAKDPAEPATHLGALVEIQPAERIVVAARQRTAHDVAQ